METSGQRFVSDLEPCIELWTSIDIRVQAIHDPRVGWKSECLRAILTTRKEPLWKNLPRDTGVLVAHEIWPIGRLADFIRFLEQGEIPIAGEKIAIKQFAGNNEWTPISNFYVRTYNREDGRYGGDYKTVVLFGYGSTSRSSDFEEARARLDARLLDCDPPWNGVSHVRRSFIGLSQSDAERQDLDWIEVVAPLPVRFGPKTEFTNSEIVLDVESPRAADAAKVRGSVFFNRGDEIVDSTRVTFRRQKGRLRARRALPGACSGATCFLTYRGVVTDRKQTFRTAFLEEDPRWSGFRALVGEPDALKQALREAEGGDPLEHAAGMLFHLLGFATAHIGQNTFRTSKGTTDILAFSPDGQTCLVIECTAGEPDLAGKIGKLATRTKMVEQMHPGTMVQPVFLTRQSRTEFTKTPKKVAADERVAVVTRDDFDDLVQLASGIPRPDQVLLHLSRLVPTGII